MCGFVGFFGSGAPEGETILRQMVQTLNHRGPDDQGVWFDQSAGGGLAHARLAIVDLSAAGHQPMATVCGRYQLVFNGEIYNHHQLRAELETAMGPLIWRGHSDTETLLQGFAYWGVKTTLQKAIGMFALALWDLQTRQLILARDRAGEKPLYYGSHQGCFMFGSELRALQQHPSFEPDIDRQALVLFFKHNYIPAPYSIYRGIFKLLPGQLLVADIATAQITTETYWDAQAVYQQGQQQPFGGSPVEAIATLDQLLTSAVGQQMVADVPLGAFLSGGIDSSTIVALMQKQSSRPVKTFSIGFDDQQFNEAIHAKAVARHLNTEHHELYVSSDDALAAIPKISGVYDEPFADASQIPTYLVAAMARQHVTVSLSGDAGDELFGGYERYLANQKLSAKLATIPQTIQHMLASTIRACPVPLLNGLAWPLKKLSPAIRRQGNIGDKLHKATSFLGFNDPVSLYETMVSLDQNPQKYVAGTDVPANRFVPIAAEVQNSEPFKQLMYIDFNTYLPDDILVKVDRASMAVSLESRVPMLDHRVIEFAATLPMSLNVRDGKQKWCLRQVLYQYVPPQLVERPKQGFAVPLADWLRGPLREWADSLLQNDVIEAQGLLNPVYIRELWHQHLSGQRNWHNQLWNVLMFQDWLAQQNLVKKVIC